MQTWFRIVIGIVLAAAAALAYADPPARVGRLNFVSGPVSFAPGEAPERWVEAPLNRPLTRGDRLWADRDGRAELHVGSTAIRVAPYTSLDVLHLDDDRLQLRLAQGSVNVRVRDLGPDDVVEIATPAGALLVREPGSYRVSADPARDLVRLAVNFGHAEVFTPSRSFVVPSGQSAVLLRDAAPYFEIAHSTDEFDRWSAERDRREDAVASTRYVSPHMTGYEDLDRHGTWRTLPEYGAVWVPSGVVPGWAPYRHGHWAWISPWGWTWIDDAPWGFAPFHYGRWVWVHDHWAWAPGPWVRRPVYAPALVAFVGGSGWSFSLRSGPAVGWFPLGWREPYRPWYRASHTHVHHVNVHVGSTTHIHQHHHHHHVHRSRPGAVTVVPQHAFVSARPVSRSRVEVGHRELAGARVIDEKPPAEPTRASVAPERPGPRPPSHVHAREVVATAAPGSAGAREQADGRERSARFTREGDEPRVRVITRERAPASAPSPEAGESPGARRARENAAEEARLRSDGLRERRVERTAPNDLREQRSERTAPEGLREQRIERAATPDGLHDRQTERAATPDALRQQRIERAAPPEGPREPRIERAAPPDGLRDQRTERAAPPDRVREQRIERAATPDSLRDRQTERAATPDSLRNRQTERAATPDALRQQRIERAAPPEGPREPRIERAAPPDGPREQRIEQRREQRANVEPAHERTEGRQALTGRGTHPEGAPVARERPPARAEAAAAPLTQRPAPPVERPAPLVERPAPVAARPATRAEEAPRPAPPPVVAPPPVPLRDDGRPYRRSNSDG